ncbi:MAG: V-type ATP synthase subunit F [Candidatus Fimenecus sp.]
MKFFLISDNVDSMIGMRLAGVEGVRVDTAQAAQNAFLKAMADPEIGILLATPKAAALCPETVSELRQSNRPLFVIIPDADGVGAAGDSITQYIREAVGVKI